MMEKRSDNKKFEAGLSTGASKIILVLLISSVLILSGLSGMVFSVVSGGKDMSLIDGLSSLNVPHPIYGTAEYDGGGWAVDASVVCTSSLGTLPISVVLPSGDWQVDCGDPYNWPDGTAFTVYINGTGAYAGWTGSANGVVSGYYNDMGNIILNSDGENNPPNTPYNPDPEDGELDVGMTVVLSVFVSDPDGDSLDVSFYNASDDSLICIDTNIESGERASVTWTGLSEYTTYCWYAVADDGEYTSQSETWSFTTQANNPPYKPVNPDPYDGEPNVILNPTLYVDVFDPDDDTLEVCFYDASDNSLICVDTGVPSDSRASCPWSGLEPNMTYSWYAVADDGEYTNHQSDTWSFTTGEDGEYIEITNIERGKLYFFGISGAIPKIEPFGSLMIDLKIPVETLTTGSISRVKFTATNAFKPGEVVLWDEDSTDGFSCEFTVPTGLYSLVVDAYDENDQLADSDKFEYLLYLNPRMNGSLLSE